MIREPQPYRLSCLNSISSQTCESTFFVSNQTSSCSPRRRHCYLLSRSFAASFPPPRSFPSISQFRSILVACGRLRVASTKFTDSFDSLSRKKLRVKYKQFPKFNSTVKLTVPRELTGEIESCNPVPCGVRSVIPA